MEGIDKCPKCGRLATTSDGRHLGTEGSQCAKPKPLVPPDRKQCQAEIREGSFMTLGPRAFHRCRNLPTVIVTEKLPGKDGQRGAMSLCDSCKQVLLEQSGPDYFTEKPIKRRGHVSGR
jgi:hypothetical protein